MGLVFGGPLHSLAVRAAPAGSRRRAWEDLYRREFTESRGDAQGFAFHCSNCQGNCAWRVFAKDGRVTREEQVASYPPVHPRIPDANPRGCNKGIVHSREMYQGDRLLHPLRRVGQRGEGKWQRITWGEAYDAVAGAVVDSLTRHGPGSLMVYCGTGILSQGRRAGPLRLGSLLGAQRLYPASAVGDMFTGASLAYGLATVGHTLDAWFECDTIILWGINPLVSRIPDAHYLTEARYRGARIYAISPDYNATAKIATCWIPVRPGTDAFVAMSLLHVLLRDHQLDEAFVKEQTDLAFLVRLDTGDFLRHRDLRRGGKDDLFYAWDEATAKPAPMPGAPGHFKKTLRLEDIRPALRGRFEVSGADGQAIPVTTVFELVQAEAAKFPPEKTQQITGVHPELIEQMARDFARARKAIINIGFSLHKYVSGTMTCWAAALACALTGHCGDRGGLDTENNWSLDGIAPLASPKPARFASGFFSEWLNGDMAGTLRRHYPDDQLRAAAGYGIDEIERLTKDKLARNASYYGKPRVLLLFADNMFRRNKAEAHHREAVLRDLDLYVNVNHRMDSSALWADIVLPATSHYETWDIRGELGYHRFCNVTIPPPGLKRIGEVRSEWEICAGLAEAIARAAAKRGIAAIPDPDFLTQSGDKAAPVMRDFQRMAADFTMDGALRTDADVVAWLMQNVPQISPWTPEDAKKYGFVVLNREAGFTSPLYANQPYYSFERNVHLRQPYKTQTGRQQFFVDHPVFKRQGWRVPTAVGPVRPTTFPFAFYTPHTRWGIHSQWRANAQLLRLQRGEPYVWLNPRTAAARSIGEGDMLRVFNDIGAFYARAKLMPAVPPDAVVTDHAWEPYMFARRAGKNSVVAGMISLIELVDGWGHLTFDPNWDGNMIAHESAVDIEKVSA